MLQLFANKVNVSRISKLLVKYNIKATVTDSTITIYGTISEDLASQLYSSTQIIAFSNYDNGQEYVPIDVTTVSENVIKSEETDMLPETKPDVIQESICEEVVTYGTSDVTDEPKFILRYPNVKRAEVYLCDFGNPFEHEQGGKRYAIIIQNDVGNEHSPNTIVIPCTTKYKHKLPVHHIFRFSSENMVDYLSAKVSSKINVALGECITTVSKSRLINYLGTMTEDFMNEHIQPIIDCSLALKRKIATVPKPRIKTVIQTKPIYVEMDLDATQREEK